MRIVWSPTAMRDLGEIRRYIRRTTLGPQPARACETFPGSAAPAGCPTAIPRTPDIVPYTVRGEVIEIRAVLHGVSAISAIEPLSATDRKNFAITVYAIAHAIARILA